MKTLDETWAEIMEIEKRIANKEAASLQEIDRLTRHYNADCRAIRQAFDDEKAQFRDYEKAILAKAKSELTK